jgi:hypothetical protein
LRDGDDHRGFAVRRPGNIHQRLQARRKGDELTAVIGGAFPDPPAINDAGHF